ncbi:nucleoside-diphosphate kinase [Pediococcus claussenii]|nr:nucleoside-diphosphate kinase [Pediococcus claussenii]ANZ69272.1 nucleoside-diphosphate kinase [Pediococcus claussenii]ANZ71091.1 nucleoside-diphosphate kinase [Pediococcus claussenii]KRN20375.1 ndk protein [Pediococcus claussenii]
MTEERTLMLVKPDGVASGHVGDVITRIENRRFKITAIRTLTASPEELRVHYQQLVGKSFYSGIEDFMTSGPIVAMIISGSDVVESIRKMTGPTDPAEAPAGTIRGDFARGWGDGPIQNVVHSSDSIESAEREIKIWFPDEK